MKTLLLTGLILTLSSQKPEIVEPPIYEYHTIIKSKDSTELEKEISRFSKECEITGIYRILEDAEYTAIVNYVE